MPDLSLRMLDPRCKTLLSGEFKMLQVTPPRHPRRFRHLLRLCTYCLLVIACNGSILAAQDDSWDDELFADHALVSPIDASAGSSSLRSFLEDVSVKFYGHVKGDVSYDTSDTRLGSSTRWVNVEDQNKPDDGQFNITAKQTRLGVNLQGSEEDEIQSSARVEVDFFAAGTPENNGMFRMRHAYVSLDWVDKDMSLIVGQTSDVFSPLVMPTIDHTTIWESGDVGFRRNQVQLFRGIDVGSTHRVEIQVAGTRVMGAEDVGRPGVQARLSFSFPASGDQDATIGVSALRATEAGSTDANARAIDLSIPLGRSTRFTAEAFGGENLDAYAGNIGVPSVIPGMELEATGYWAAINHTLSDVTSINVGFGRERNEHEGLAAGTRVSNSTAFANVNHKVNPATTVSFEAAQHSTEYQADDSYDDLRLQFSLKFSF